MGKFVVGSYVVIDNPKSSWDRMEGVIWSHVPSNEGSESYMVAVVNGETTRRHNIVFDADELRSQAIFRGNTSKVQEAIDKNTSNLISVRSINAETLMILVGDTGIEIQVQIHANSRREDDEPTVRDP